MEDTQIEQCSGPLEFVMSSQRPPLDVQPPTPLSRLRYVPWFAGAVLAIEGGYALMHRRLDVGSWPFC